VRPRRLCAALVLMALLAISCAVPTETDAPRFRDLSSGNEVSLTEALPRFADARAVFLGESHDAPSHHAAQLAVIRALFERGARPAVGLEMFRKGDQAVLDAWVAGRLDENDMRLAFARNWSLDWALYRDIFLYCRERAIPMVGLNIPREIAAQVAEEGFASLSPRQAAGLPPVSCAVDPAYAAFLRQVYGAHGGAGEKDEEGFAHFCEAQSLRDAAMAHYAAGFMASRPDAVLVILTGAVHAWRPAMPTRLRLEAGETELVVVLPRDPSTGQAGPADADYLLLLKG